jgi:hypothetical protein
MATKNRFPSIKKGATFNGRDMKIYNGVGENKVPMDLTGVLIELEFKVFPDNCVSPIIFKFSTADGSIKITGTGVARMMPRLMKYAKAIYTTDPTLTFANGTVKPWGQVLWEIN